MVWTPRVTVASIIEEGGRFLMVEELVDGERVVNQPAGHLEPGEALVTAAVRETLEETGRRLLPEGLVGIYRWRHPATDVTYLRITVCGRLDPDAVAVPPVDTKVLASAWMSEAQLAASPARLRSPMVLRSIRDYRDGQRLSLSALVDLEAAS